MKMTVATIQVDANGRHVIASWLDWEPMPELRWVVPPYTTTKSPVLQQRWVRGGYNTAGQLADHEYEWRTVPTMVEESHVR